MVNASLKQDAKILIVLMGSLGDVVRGLALAGQLKQQLKQCQITWLVEPKCAEVVRLNKYIDHVIVFERRRSWLALPALVKELRKQRFDLTLDLQRHFKSGVFSFLSKAKRRIGFHSKNSKEFNWGFNNEQIKQVSEDVSKLEHYLLFIEKLGLQIVRPLDFGLEHAANLNFPELLPATYAVLILGSSWDSKDWPSEGYQKLIGKLLQEKKYRIVLLGDKSKIAMAQILENFAESKEVVNLAGKTSLKDIIDLIGNSNFCIGPDSGPAHIAGALGVRYISLFGPTSWQRTAPFGSEDLVLQSKIGCSPCYRRNCPGLGKLCMRLITPESVMAKVHSLA